MENQSHATKPHPCNDCPNSWDRLPDELFELTARIDALGLGIDTHDAITQALCAGCGE